MRFHSFGLVAITTPLALAGVARPAPATLQSRGGGKPGLPYDGKTTTHCSFWIDNAGSQDCTNIPDAYGITLEDFLRWNPSVTSDCDNFLSGRSYCVEAMEEPTSSSTSSSTISPTITKGPPSTPTETSITSVSETSTPTKPSNGITTPTPTQPDMVPNCDKFYFVKRGDSCAKIANSYGISIANFAMWNPKVGTDCTGLWADTYACVSTIGREPGTPTEPSNGIETPQPTQPDISSVCNKFHFVKAGQSCGSIASENGISVADFVGWNAKVGNDCSGLWANANACVGVIRFYDFNDGTSNRWSPVDGAYNTKSKALVASEGGKAVLKTPFTDFIYKAQITLPSEDGNAGVIFRASNVGAGADNYRGYYVGISAGVGSYVNLGRANNDWSQLIRVPIDIQPGQTYLIKVMALADEISVFVDDLGTPKLTYRDGTYRSGFNGVRTYATGATFDNVEMSPIVYDNFEKNMVGWKIYDGGFDAGSEELVASDVYSGKAVLDTTFEDFVIEADITLPESGSGNAGFVFRATSLGDGADAYHGYYAGIETDGGVTLGRADGSWKSLDYTSMDIRAGQKYHMKIQALGDSLSIFVDDVGSPKITVKDGTFKRGVTGLRVHRSGAKVDNYRVQKK